MVDFKQEVGWTCPPRQRVWQSFQACLLRFIHHDQEFDGNSSTHKVIIQGAEYIVYYLDGTEEIMSAELISGVD